MTTERKKTNILYLMDILSGVGGTERQLAILINNMDREYFRPRILVLKNDELSGRDDFEGFNCPVEYVGFTKIISINFIISFLKIVRTIKQNDIDILQTFFIDSNLVGIPAAILSGVKYRIVSRRDMGYWYNTKILWALRIINKFASCFIVNSFAIKNNVSSNEHIDPEKIKVIYNAIDKAPGPDGRTKVLRKTMPDTIKIVGIVSNLRKVKQIDLFIRMAKLICDKHDDVYFVIIGEGDLHDVLVQYSKALNIYEKINFIHVISNILDYISDFDVGVLTSESEGFSNALLEYQICGIPSVAFDVGGNNEIIENGKSGFLVNPFDVNDMHNRTMELLFDESLNRRLGNYAREQARKKYGVKKMIMETQRLYSNCIQL